MTINQLSFSSYAAFLLCACIALLYVPGLSGTFLLDDFSTLSPLAQWGEIDSLDKLRQFIFGGHSGPTGRPIPLFTFTLNGTTWPADPLPFIATNICIHASNTYIVFLFVRELCKFSPGDQSSTLYSLLPIISASIWGLHPYHVSSVLYIVQRMTLLSAGFSFLCFFLYLRARSLFILGGHRTALVFLFLAACSSLAALFSKENAVLIPLQLVLLELYLRWVQAPKDLPAIYRTMVVGVSILASIVLLKLLDYGYPHFKALLVNGEVLSSRREFTFFERLLTESRVLGDYVMSIMVPQAQTSGVFQDGYPLSKSLTDPISTLLWLIFHSAMLLVVWLLRLRIPLLALGIFWFYIGHLVESTVVMLEIKFEHRNYLPSLGLVLVTLSVISSIRTTRRIFYSFVGAVLILLVLTLFARTSLWGKPEQAALVWVEENPNSVRALENAALVLSKSGVHKEEVARFLRIAAEKASDDPVLLLKYFNYVCDGMLDSDIDWRLIAGRFKTSPVNWQLYHVLSESLDTIASQQCRHMKLGDFDIIASQILANRYYQKTGTPRLVRELQARAALIFGEKTQAVERYLSEIERLPPLSLAMRYALWLASYGEQAIASEILALALVQRRPEESPLYAQALDMKRQIDADVAVKGILDIGGSEE